jgi:hypothetical protein
MTLDEALEAAVLGERVRADTMQPGSYVDYHFNGWRRNFESGSSSGWHQTEADKAAEWSIFVEPPKPALGKWGPPVIKRPEPNQPADADRRWGKLIAGTPPAIDDDIPPPRDSWGRPI